MKNINKKSFLHCISIVKFAFKLILKIKWEFLTIQK